MQRVKVKIILNILVFFSFLSSFITGLVKTPGLLKTLGVSTISLPMYRINQIHDLSGVVLGLLIITHLALHRGWIKSYLSTGARRYAFYALVAAGGLLFSFYLLGVVGTSQRATRLASREVREYQGEDLSSINDLIETSIGGTQRIDPGNYTLAITGLVDKPQKYTYDQVLSFDNYSKVVDINCVTGWSAKILWEGVLLSDLLKSAGIRPEAKTAIFYAIDGFTTSLPLDYIIKPGYYPGGQSQ